MKSILLTLLRFYQLCISPFLGQNCRFFPSCSEYARDAIAVHGPITGSVMAGRRLCKCHPWHVGGCDPVPGTDRTAKPSQATASEAHH